MDWRTIKTIAVTDHAVTRYRKQKGTKGTVLVVDIYLIGNHENRPYGFLSV